MWTYFFGVDARHGCVFTYRPLTGEYLLLRVFVRSSVICLLVDSVSLTWP